MPQHCQGVMLIPWMMKSWLLETPGHQQPWYGQWRISRSMSSIVEDWEKLCPPGVGETAGNANLPLCSLKQVRLSVTYIHHLKIYRTLSNFANDIALRFRIWQSKLFNLSRPSATYMRLWALVQIMACRMDSAKPLSELMLTYHQLDPK